MVMPSMTGKHFASHKNVPIQFWTAQTFIDNLEP